MNQFFPRVTIMSLVIVFSCSVLATAQAVEVVPQSGLPVLVEPGTENNSIPIKGDDVSTAVLRKLKQLRCNNAMEAAGEAKKALQANADNSARGQEYRLAYNDYMRLKKLCIESSRALNERLAAEENGDESTEGFDPTDPLTAQWAGTWNVKQRFAYRPYLLYGTDHQVYSSELVVKISREGCEVTFHKNPQSKKGEYVEEEGYNCRARGRTLTFYNFYRNDNKSRVDFVFLHSGLTLKGQFSGIIRGKPAGGQCTGEKAGY